MYDSIMAIAATVTVAAAVAAQFRNESRLQKLEERMKILEQQYQKDYTEITERIQILPDSLPSPPILEKQNIYDHNNNFWLTGFFFDNIQKKYVMYNCDIDTFYDQFHWIIRREDSIVCSMKIDRRNLPILRILQGEPFIGSRGDVWSLFRTSKKGCLPLLFGLNFDYKLKDLNSFVLHDEASLRFKYNKYKILSQTVDFERRYERKNYLKLIYGDVQCDFYEQLFCNLELSNEEECIGQCLVQNIWSLREAFKCFFLSLEPPHHLLQSEKSI